ncbi:MAG: alpha/beta hydrolase [Actinomycetota bacterium]|nr:alpha/beta hydrolase [Actinomycetota bacterium]
MLASREKVGIRRGAGRWLFGGAALLAAVSAAGAVYQSFAVARDRGRHPSPGRLADAGGHRLHLNVAGEGQGGPTVVLEAGGTGFSPQWARVRPGIAEFARVVSYDRAGLGWSEPGPNPRDARPIAEELRAALRSAGIEGPYVPVGSSLGGLYALAFADAYPEETAGVVLVDSMHPDQWERLPDRLVHLVRSFDRIIKVLPPLARLGALRALDLTRPMQGEFRAGLPPEERAQMEAVAATPEHWEAVYEEVSGSWEETRGQVRTIVSRGLGEKPLLVLTAPDNPGFGEMKGPWLEMQVELAALSSRGEHRVLEGASHIGTMTDPATVREVVEAVRRVVEVARQGALRPSRPAEPEEDKRCP